MDWEVFYGLVSRGALRELIDYVAQFPENERASEQYAAIFERGEHWSYGLPEKLESVLRCYLDYFLEVFYLEEPEPECAQHLLTRLRTQFPEAPDATLDELETRVIPDLFAAEGWCINCGMVNGYHSPFLWHTTEWKSFDVELPDGTQSYTIRLCREPLLMGHEDYLSLGEYSVGGWVGDDGIINCFIDTYDTDSEDFNISLLKHEAQHVRDLADWPNISDGYLEYRAYLVELIYCTERNRLTAFAEMADTDQPENEHSMAAYDVAYHYYNSLGTDDFASIPIPTIQKIARKLFHESNQALIDTFGPKT